MSKNSVFDWDPTAANNTDVGGIGLSDATPLDDTDNIFRELMAQGASYLSTDGKPWRVLDDQTASNDSEIVFTGIPAGAAMVEIEFSNVVPATDSQNLRFRTSANNGSSYDSGSGNYKYEHVRATVGGSVQELGEASATEIVLTSGLGTGTAEQGSGTVRVFNPGASAYTWIKFEAGGIDASGAMFNVDGSAVRMAVGAVDAVRLYFSSGNIASGRFVCRYHL